MTGTSGPWPPDSRLTLTPQRDALNLDLELDDRASVRAFLEREGLVRCLTPEGSLFFGRWTDSAGNDLWSLNLGIGDDVFEYAEVTPLLQGYNKGW